MEEQETKRLTIKVQGRPLKFKNRFYGFIGLVFMGVLYLFIPKVVEEILNN